MPYCRVRVSIAIGTIIQATYTKPSASPGNKVARHIERMEWYIFDVLRWLVDVAHDQSNDQAPLFPNIYVSSSLWNLSRLHSILSNGITEFQMN